MPITQSAKKAMRQSSRRREQNIKRKRNVKDAVKSFRKLVADKKTAEATEMLSKVFKVLDKTAKTGVLKKNTADRTKSRLAKLLVKVK